MGIQIANMHIFCIKDLDTINLLMFSVCPNLHYLPNRHITKLE
jgi:hypothetical protein